MTNLQSKQWQKGDWIYINKLVWDFTEVNKVLECMENDWFGKSKYHDEFESKFSQLVGSKYAQLVNSGSAGLEIAVQALIQKGLVKRGDKVLHCAQTFPTSISGAIMAGLVPVYVDCGYATYVANTEVIKKALEEHDIKLILLPALLGNMFDLDVCLNAGLPIIIDSCDTIGTKWDGKDILSLGTIAITSYYGSHHISCGGIGGMITTNDDELYKIINSMTYWGRDFEVEKKDQLTSFTKRYSYFTIGKDSQMSAIQVAFGLAQLERLPEYIGRRDYIFKELYNLFRTKLKYFILPERVSDKCDPSWFCYPLVVRQGSPFTRDELVRYLLDNKVEVRPIMCNILDNDVYRKSLHYIVGDLKNTLEIERNGIFIPAFAMPKEQFEYYYDILKRFLEKY